jgi:hypothetical protein
MELNIERLQELVIQYKVIESKDILRYEDFTELKRLKNEIMTMLKETF